MSEIQKINNKNSSIRFAIKKRKNMLVFYSKIVKFIFIQEERTSCKKKTKKNERKKIFV